MESFFELELTLAKEQIDSLDTELNAHMNLLSTTSQVRFTCVC
jgi:hypothetical protein